MATSKAAAAEARRQKLLARGGDRLQGILGGLPASNIAERKTEELPQGRLLLSSLPPSACYEHNTEERNTQRSNANISVLMTCHQVACKTFLGR